MYSNLLEKQNKKLNVIETLKQNKNIFVILDLYHIRGPQAGADLVNWGPRQI